MPITDIRLITTTCGTVGIENASCKQLYVCMVPQKGHKRAILFHVLLSVAALKLHFVNLQLRVQLCKHACMILIVCRFRDCESTKQQKCRIAGDCIEVAFCKLSTSHLCKHTCIPVILIVCRFRDCESTKQQNSKVL